MSKLQIPTKKREKMKNTAVKYLYLSIVTGLQ